MFHWGLLQAYLYLLSTTMKRTVHIVISKLFPHLTSAPAPASRISSPPTDNTNVYVPCIILALRGMLGLPIRSKDYPYPVRLVFTEEIRDTNAA